MSKVTLKLSPNVLCATRLSSCLPNTRHLISAAMALLIHLPVDVRHNFWTDQLHGYFHGLYTLEIAAKFAGDRMQNPLFAKALVLASLMHDATAFRDRTDHAKTGSDMIANLCQLFPFWRPVKEMVRQAILTHEGKLPYPKPQIPLAAFVHDADRLQEITDVDRIAELSEHYKRKFFDPDLPLDWRLSVLGDHKLRDHKRNDNHMYFMDNLYHCFRRDNFITDKAYREAMRIRPFVVDRMMSLVEAQLTGEELGKAVLLLYEALARNVILST